MGVNVTLVVPTVNPRELLHWESTIVDRWGGGLTTWEGIGVWKDGLGHLIREPITVFACSVQAIVDDDTYGWWHGIADAIRRAFIQDCVFLSFTLQDAELVGNGFTERIGGNDANISDAR